MLETIIIPKDVTVIVDKRTKANTVAFPVDFPSGTHGVVMITRLSPFPWKPELDITELTIKFKDHEEPKN